MGLFIKIEKISENDKSVKYKFWPSEDETRIGILELDKITGEIGLIQAILGDNVLYPRASRKVFINWKNGELPDRMSWAT